VRGCGVSRRSMRGYHAAVCVDVDTQSGCFGMAAMRPTFLLRPGVLTFFSERVHQKNTWKLECCQPVLKLKQINTRVFTMPHLKT
jgi:hypothetical protein